MNTLVVIGWLSNRRVYLNISREEAIKRYAAAEENPLIDSLYLANNGIIDEFTFDDEFGAYDVWALS